MAKIAYTIELTAEEYRSAMYMDDRGYLGQIITHATHREEMDDESGVILAFTEPDAWKVVETCEDDPDARPLSSRLPR